MRIWDGWADCRTSVLFHLPLSLDEERRRNHIVRATTTTMSDDDDNERRRHERRQGPLGRRRFLQIIAAEFARVIKLVFWSFSLLAPPAPSMPPLSFMPRETDRQTWQMPPTPSFAFVLHKGPAPPSTRDFGVKLREPQFGRLAFKWNICGGEEAASSAAAKYPSTWARARFSTPTEHLSSRDLSGMSLQWMDRRED